VTEPTTNRWWLRTRVPGKLGIVLSVLGAFVAGVPLSVFIGGGNVLFLVFAVLLFAAVGWSFAASVTKLRQERASSK
jgi:hypothetical protein